MDIKQTKRGAKNSSKEGIFSLFTALVVMLFVLASLVTVIDLSSANQFDSSNPFISDEKIQFELRKRENLFRDKIYQEIKNIKTLKKISVIDSIFELNTEADRLKNYVVADELRHSKSTKYSFKIPLEIGNSISIFVKLDSIKATYQINFDELNKIFDSNKSSDIKEHDIKYGNFISSSYTLQKKLRYDYLILAVFFTVVVVTLNYFRNRIGLKKEKPFLEALAAKIARDKIKIDIISKNIKNDKLNEKRILELEDILLEVQRNVDNYNFDDLLKSMMYEDLSKAEKKANELYNRSTLMLVLGLLVGVVGILVFYITLPEIDSNVSVQGYLALIIRPTFVLIFIQSISIYLLRQYRTLIHDYKYFYHEYLKKTKLFTVYQLSKKGSLNEIEIKLIDHLLLQEVINHSKDEDVFPKDSSEILKTFIEQLKSKGL